MLHGLASAAALVLFADVAQAQPAAPTGLLTVPFSESVMLFWDDPNDSSITGYELSIDNGTFNAINPTLFEDGDLFFHTVQNLQDGTTYSFAVRAVSTSGNGAAATVTATPIAKPSAPANLTAAAGDGQATLSWTDPEDANITGYMVSTDAGANYAAIADSADITTHTVTGLTNGTEYTFKLLAVNASGNGAAATVTETPIAKPAAPTGLAAAVGDAQLTLSWSNPSDSTIDKYQYSTNAGSSYSDITGSGASTTTHTVTGLTNGTEYTLAVRAVNESGNGAAATVTETPIAKPAAPTGLAAAVGDAQLTLSWSNPSDSTIDKYQYSTNAGSSYSDITGSGASTTTHTVTGLTNGTEYTLAVRAVNESGNGAAATVTETPLGPPAAPTGLAAAAGDPAYSVIGLSWTAPAADTARAAVSGYLIEWSTSGSGGPWTQIDSSDGAATSYQHSGLAAASTYHYRVSARSASSGDSAASTVVSAATAPAAPTGLAAAVGDAQLTLSWSNPSDSTIDKYQYSTNAGSSYSDITGSGASTTTHTVTGLTNGTEYTLAVRAVNESGNGAAATVTETPIAKPAAPTGLAAAVGDAQLTLSWSNPSDSTIDKYQYSTNAGSSYSDITGSGASTTTHTVTGLTNGTEYTLAVRAVNESGNGAAATVTETPIAKPAAPTGLAAAVGDAQLTLSWSNPSDSTIDKYQYSTNAGSSYSDITGSGASTTTHTVTGLTNGTEYTLAVRAVNESGNGAAATVTETPIAKPAAPTGLAAAVGDAQLTLSWSNPSDSTIDKYQYSTNAGSSYSDITGSGASTTTHTVTGLTNGTEYTLAVRAVNESGNGAAATVTETPLGPPAAPTGLAAAAGDPAYSVIGLSWTAPAADTARAAVSGYLIEWSTSGSGGPWTQIDSSDGAATSYQHSGLAAASTYHYRVSARSASSGDSAASTVVSAATAPAAPTGLAAAVGDAQLTLSWSNPSDSTIDKYQYSTNAGSSYSDITGSGASTTTHTVTGLTNGTEYTLAVRAVNESGNGAAATVTETPIAKPAAPTGLAAAVGDAQLTLSWSNPSDSTIDKYQYSTNAGSSYSDITGSGASTTTHTVTGLTNGTEYTLAVRAVNESGNGAAATVTETPIAKPAAPTGLAAAVGDAQLTLSWSNPSDSTIDKYQYSTNAGSSYSDITGSGASTTTHTVTGLTNGTEYTLAVRAVNESGNGAAATVTETPIAKPAAPTGLAAAVGDAQLTLSWSNPSDSTIDKYQYSTNAGSSYSDITGSGASTTTHTVTGLTNGTEYTLAVRAVNESGNGAAATVTETPLGPPAAPTGLAAAAGDPAYSVIGLSWTAPAADTARAAVSGYLIEWSTSGSGGPWTQIDSSDGAATSYQHSGLAAASTYHYRVSARSASSGDSAASTVVSAATAPAAPTGLAAAVGDAQLTLSWSNPSDSTIDKYQYSTNAGSSYSDITGSGASTTTHTVTGLTNGTEYTLAVRAVNESGNGAAATVTETPIAKPAAPTGLAAAVGDAQLTLSWSNPSDSTIDKYQYSTNAGSSYSDITGSGASTTTHTVTGLTNGTEYTLAVRAVNESGNGAAATVTETPIAKPAAPTGLAAAVGDAQLTLSWSNPSDSTIDKYQYSTNAGSSYSDITGSGASTTTHTVTGLTNGTEYTLAVRAVNESGNGAAATVTETPIAKPAAPTGLAAAVGDAQLTLSWSNPSDSTIDKYQYSTNAGSSYSDITGSGASTTTHTVTGLTNGTEYTLAVRAVNESGNGAAATVTETPLGPPAAPTGLAAAAGDPAYSVIGLSWTAPAADTARAAVSGYLIEWSTSGSGGPWTQIDSSDGAATSYQHSGLAAASTYHYRVSARSASSGDSAASTVVSAATAPAAPTGLAAAVGDAQLTLSWSNPSDSTIDKYQYSTNAGSSYSDITGSGASTTTHTVTGLTNGTEYTLAVRAVNESGNGAAATVTETPIAKPAAPTGLAAAVGDAQLTLSWSNPSDSTIDKYQYSTNAGSSYSDITGSGASTTTHTVTGLTNGTEYTLAVRAVNESGNGAAATVTETPIAKPAAPTGLAAAVGDAQLTLSWSNPSDSTIDKYQYSTNAGSSYSDITGSGASTTTHTVTGLTNGTEYTLAVRAVNESGNGAAATVTETPIAKPAAPTGLAAAVGDAQLTLSWSNPSDSTIDKYQYSTNAGSSYSDITGSGASTTTHTVTGLTNGTEYTLAVRAVNESGNGAAATVTETPLGPPAAPTGLAAAAGDPAYSVIGLSWTAPAADTARAAVSGYLIEWSTSGSGGPWTQIDSSDGAATSYQHSGLAAASTYHYRVSARSASSGDSAASTVVSAATAPAPSEAPTGLSAAPGNEQVKLSWNNPNDDTITGYRYRPSTNGGRTFGTPIAIPGSNKSATYHTVEDLTNGTKYTFEVESVRKGQNYSGWSNQATATPLQPRVAPRVAPRVVEPQFVDVHPSSAHANNIDTLLAARFTTGCSTDPLMYCPDRAVTRAQMASFLTRALKMYTASERKTERIIDVDPSSAHANSIDVLFAAGITTGCSTEPLMYCPDRAVTRAEMASFLVRALDLPAGAFARRAPKIMDLDSSSVHATNIKALFAARITTGCRTDPLMYCPDRPVTRSQMASFLVRAFDLD